MKSLLLGFGLLAGAIPPGTAVAADGRGVPLQIRASEVPGAPVVEEVQLYSKSHALVIGIDDYAGGWPRLSNAVRDAAAVAAALRAHGFEVSLRTDVTSIELKDALERFFVLNGADPDARLFVWFAGHGYTENGEGFIVPKDAPGIAAGPQFRLKALSLRRFGEYVRLARSKHAFAVFDSCFSGTIFATARSAPPPAITAATVAPVRQFLSSGDAGQEVSDDGTFRKLFIEALGGARRADANGDGYLTASELGMFLTDRVTNYSNRRQTPRYGKLNDPEFDQGDFVFRLPAAAMPSVATAPSPVPRAAPPTASPSPELLFWQSIQDSEDPAVYEDYLAQYPNGAYTQIARRRVERLRQARLAVARPPSSVAPSAPAPVPVAAPWFSGDWCRDVGGQQERYPIIRYGADGYRADDPLRGTSTHGVVRTEGPYLITEFQHASQRIRRRYAVQDGREIRLVQLWHDGAEASHDGRVYYRCGR